MDSKLRIGIIGRMFEFFYGKSQALEGEGELCLDGNRVGESILAMQMHAGRRKAPLILAPCETGLLPLFS